MRFGGCGSARRDLGGIMCTPITDGSEEDMVITLREERERERERERESEKQRSNLPPSCGW